MRNDSLEELLERTDAELPPRPIAGALAERIRTRMAREARRRLAVAVVASAVIALAAMHALHPRPRMADQGTPTHAPRDVGRCRAELAQLNAMAELHERAAEQLEMIRRSESARRRIVEDALLVRDPLAHLDEARDRAARIMLLDADRLASVPGEKSQAQATYRRAAQLFPDTPAAREAAGRLRAFGA